MDRDTGMEFISDMKFNIGLISGSYEKVAALRIHEINSNSVIKEMKYAMFILHRVQSHIKHMELAGISDFTQVTTSQAFLLLEKLNEVNRLTKIYRAVRIVRNERSRYGKDLSLEDRSWADRYLELCRNRGLNLTHRKFAAMLLNKISETISIYRLLTIKETSLANTNVADPTNFTIDDFQNLDPIKIQEKVESVSNSNYPKNGDLLKKILAMRDSFSKLLGFENYIDYSLQSQLFTPERVTNILVSLADQTLPKWVQRREASLQKKKEHAEACGATYDGYFFLQGPALFLSTLACFRLCASK